MFVFFLHGFAEFCDRGVKGVDSLFFLPEVVLHGSDFSLHELAVADLFIDIEFFIPDL